MIVRLSDLMYNFPYSDKRQNQPFVLNEISEAYNSGYKHIILEAPTGFGKSAVAVAVALTMGSSYICTSTKDLQRQYSNDFPYLRLAKGKNNFPCLVKEDFVMNQTYKCGICTRIGMINTNKECSHLSVEYGPCMINKDFKDAGCKYRTFLKDYKVSNKGTKEERISISSDVRLNYQNDYSRWLHIKNFQTNHTNTEWRPCGYFDQLNTALTASHSIFNYSNFLALLPNKKVLPKRQLLILDEGHLIETELIKFRGLSIYKKRWKRYIQNFKMIDYGYNDIGKWIEFLINIETNMLKLLGEESLTEILALERKIKYRFDTSSIKEKKKTTSKRIISAPDLFDSDEEISKKYIDFSNRLQDAAPGIIEEIAVEAIRDLERLTRTINNILEDPSNWIVSEIQKENVGNNKYEVIRVDFKPLDVSKYCQRIFEKCERTLIMSATILNHKAFCKSVGISYDNIKYIKIPSQFPVEIRPIYPLNIAYLNFHNLQLNEVKLVIANAIDNLMSIHNNDKGIIHTTSYEQLNFIKERLSIENSRRLIVTDPEIQREEIIEEHTTKAKEKPTVLISPSLNTGLDLKDELSRFQIITKVPYPNKNDRWINAKREKDQEWYYWQTAVRLVQAYGRSIRSKDDWAKTYVLDSAFEYFIKKNSDMLPEWFVNAIRDSNKRHTNYNKNDRLIPPVL